MEESETNCWMLNTGWTAGPYGRGERISIKDTRDILSMIYDGTIDKLGTFEHAHTGLNVPKVITIDLSLLKPELGWNSFKEYTTSCESLMDQMNSQLNIS